MRLFLQTFNEVESANQMPVDLPKQHIFRNKLIGNKELCIISTKRLYETVLGNSLFKCS